MRKDAGLELDDRIALRYEADGELAQALDAFGDYIKQETLATSLEAGDTNSSGHRQMLALEGNQVALGLTKV